MQPGDRIISIGGTAIHKWEDISSAVSKHSHEVVTVTIDRNGTEMKLDMIPKTDTQTDRAMLGVMPVITNQSHSFFESAGMAVQRTGQICQLMIVVFTI